MRLTACLVLLTCLILQASATEVRTVLHLPLDGTPGDASDSALTVQATGELAWMPGQRDQALKLDGTNGLSVRQAAELHVGKQSWTVEAWIKPEREQLTPNAVILGGGWGGQRQYSLRLQHAKLLSANLLSGDASPYRVSGDVSEILFDGAWHQVALVIDRERYGEVRLYLDGRRVDDAASPAFVPPIEFEKGTMGVSVGGIAPWYLGKNGFVGGVDEVRISNGLLPAYVETAKIEPPAEPPAPPVFVYDAAASATPWTLQPETTLIVTNAGVVETGTAEAGQLLQAHLRRIYGVTTGFERVSEKTVASIDGKLILALGPTRWLAPATPDELHRYGYVIQRKANVIAICGGQSAGTLYGAVRFLDDVAGVRFYMPGELFTSTGKSAPLTVGALDIRLRPFVRSAFMSGIGGMGGEWLKLNGGYRRLGGTHQHSMWERFPPSRYAERLPEIYPIVNGERRIPADGRDQDWNPCFTEPRLLDAATDSATRYFRQNPDHDYIAFSIQDSHVICQCERCLAAYQQTPGADERFPLEPGHSVVYWRFMNALAERLEPTFPDKKIVGLAYASTRFVPPFKLHRNIVVFCNFHIAELAADKILVPGESGVSRLDAWLNVCDAFGNHDWYHGNGFVMPRTYTHYWSDFMKALAKRLPEGSYQHAECYPNWGLDGPKYWLLAQLWWNPDADVDQLWQKFSTDMFGPAAEPMVDYFQRLEQLWITLDNVKGPERKLFRWDTQLITDAADRQELQACRADLDQALKLATTDAQRQRLQLFAKTFRLTEMIAELTASEKVTQAQLDAIRTYGAEQLADDPMTLYFSGKPDAFAKALDGILSKFSVSK